MSRVTQTARSGADLDDIWLRVAFDDPAAADRLVDQIVSRCGDLAQFPRLGPGRPEIAPDARMLVVGDYLILYRLAGDDVRIVRIVHGARQLGGLFESEPER